MTVPITAYKSGPYLGDNVSTVFAYSFKIYVTTDLLVQKILISSGAVTTLMLGTDYTVSGAGSASGGNVTLGAALGSTYKLVILPNFPLSQNVHYSDNQSAPAATQEEVADRAVIIAKQLQEQLNRAILLDPTQSAQIVFPAPVPGYVVGWDITGTKLQNYPNSSTGFDAALAASAAASAAAAAVSETNAAASAAAAAASAASGGLPTLGAGDVGKGLVVNAGHTGYDVFDWAAFNKVLAMSGKIMKFDKGADIASANTITLGEDGNLFKLTGTTQINTITAKKAGTMVALYFTGALTVKNGTGNIILNNGDFLTAANSILLLWSIDGTNWLEVVRGPAPSSASHGIEIFTASGTFTAKTTKSYISGVAGGGGGGKGVTGGKGGGGGGGQAVINYPFTTVIGNNYTVTIGAGGAGEGGSPAVAGGGTSFDSLSLGGGAAGSTSGGAGGGGLDGNDTAAGFAGIKGGNGATPSTNSTGGGGGGTPFGPGGAGHSSGAVGSNAPANSGGGGGGGAASGNNGGNGADGICIVMY